MYSVADIKPGFAIELEGAPFLVLSARFSRKSQGKPNCVTKIKNLKTGAIVQRTFTSNEKVPPAAVGYRHVQYLYRSGETFTFMDLTSYEQCELQGESVGDAASFLKDGQELDILLFEERPIGVKLPATVDLKVTETTPGVRGDTATGGTKTATLETGFVVQVPLFINTGEIVRVNTETGEYKERI